MPALSSSRVRLALLALSLAIPAAALIHFIAAEAQQALLAQHPGSQTGSGHALLGQELIAMALLGALTIAAVWLGPKLLGVPGDRSLLSAAEPLAAGDSRSRTDMDRERGGESQGLQGLTEGDMARATLFSAITHDLRSPLTSIKAASSLMLDHDADLAESAKRDLLENVQEAADNLDRLITNAVQLSRSRTGGLDTRKIPAAMDEVASRTLERLRRKLRDHRVVLVIPEDLPDIPVDVMQLDQVLANLLENAARFSPPGSEIALSIMNREGSVVIRIEDRGSGIPAEERQHVFDPFVKLAAGGGAGLGLAVSREIIEAHGGRLTLEDAPGGGTAAVLELPVASVLLPEVSKGGVT